MVIFSTFSRGNILPWLFVKCHEMVRRLEVIGSDSASPVYARYRMGGGYFREKKTDSVDPTDQ